jgi:hypothetical protein
VKQMINKSAFFEISDGRMLEHPRSLGVGSQFSLRWFFQHALAWKNHVPVRIYRRHFTSLHVEWTSERAVEQRDGTRSLRPP